MRRATRLHESARVGLRSRSRVVPASNDWQPPGLRARRTPLVASGFLAGALIGALPPVQDLSWRWQCMASGGRYEAAQQTCEYRAAQPQPGARGAPPPVKLLNEADR